MSARGGGPPETIIVGYDGRDSSHDAVALGLRMARRTDARLLLALAYDPDAGAPASDATSMREAAERLLQSGMRSLPYGVLARAHALPAAEAESAIWELAEREQAVLVVLGSGESGPLPAALAGSAAERLTRDGSWGVAVAPRGYRLTTPLL